MHLDLCFYKSFDTAYSNLKLEKQPPKVAVLKVVFFSFGLVLSKTALDGFRDKLVALEPV